MTKITNNALRITTESADRSWTGVAAVWYDYTQTGTPAVNDSLNVSSISDNANGDHSPTYSVSFSAANYAHVHGGYETSNLITVTGQYNNDTRTVSTYRMFTFNGSNSTTDCDNVTTAMFGSLA